MEHLDVFKTRDEPSAARHFRNSLAELAEFTPGVKQSKAFEERVKPWLPPCPPEGFPDGSTYSLRDHLPGPSVSVLFLIFPF